jgi:hypothetical protein
MADPVRLDDDSLERLSKMLNSNRRISESAPAGGGSSVGSAPTDLLGVIGAIKSGGSALLGVVNNTLSVWQEASRIGIGFNNDAVGLRASIGVTRLGVDEYFEVLKRSQQGFTSLGGSITDSAQKFNRLSQSFSDSSAADELRSIGYTTKEFNEVLALNLAGRRIGDLNDAKVRQEVNASTQALANEMDKVAQLTGVSRREQMDALQESQKNARVQATLQVMLAQGGKDVKESYDKLKVSMTGLGLGKLGDELFTGQAKTKEAIAQLNALGPAGTQLQNAINMVRNATTETDRARAKAALEQAQAAVAQRMSQSGFLALVQRGEGETADASRSMFISARNYTETLKSVQEDAAKAGKSLSDTEAAEMARKRIDARQRGFELDIATGKEVAVYAGAKTTELAVQSAARIKDSSVALFETIEALNSAFGKSSAVRKLLDATRNIKTEDGVTTAASQRYFKDSLQRIPLSIDAGTLARDIPQILANATVEIKNILETSGIEFGTEVVNAAKTFAQNLWEGVKEWWNAPTPGRDVGTLGVTGGLFEPADFVGKIHKGETVFTPQQLEAFAKNVSMASAPVIPQEFTSMIQSIQTDLSKSKGGNDIDLFANIFKDIQTTLTPANPPSKNPADNTELIMAAQQLQSATMKFADVTSLQATATPKEEKPLPDFDKLFGGFIKGFQEQTASLANNLKTNTANIANTIPQNTLQNQVREMSRTIPSEIKQAKVEADRNSEERNRTQKPIEQEPQDKVLEVKLPGTSTLDDLKEQLDQLNNTMREMLTHSSELVDTTNKQVRATKRLDGNVALR